MPREITVHLGQQWLGISNPGRVQVSLVPSLTCLQLEPWEEPVLGESLPGQEADEDENVVDPVPDVCRTWIPLDPKCALN